ncbi:6-phospho-3-hexuloisomerase [Methanobrevibacter filiformis]|uniref:3-hexulose-6-phosphate isomerase n=1 Tax=Methanobrevibacter filiformis TaxID=55758 RepID=A0A165ZFE6_9EURY|nr:6-phospho-3-hexuloisomerase [Methanobrevibacter filiformis]KZX10641.1 3-hexulose-6-phosphate isomerase [Methanobrevibacter filiformis]
MIMKTTIEDILENIENASEFIEENVIAKFVDILTTSNKVFVIGAGRSGLVAKAFAMRLMHLGINTYVVGETISPAINDNDCIFAISGSGETKSVVSPVKIAKSRGSKILSLTSSSKSTVGKLSDAKIIIKGRSIPDDEEDYVKRQMDGNYSSLTPMGTIFELTSLIFLDGLIAELMEKTGETEKNMKDRHNVLE